MASFNIASAKTLKLEGGYQDDPDDFGNYMYYNKTNPLIGTNHGITPSTYYDYFRKVPTVDDMKALTVDQAKNIYKILYWDKVMEDLLNNQSIAEILFDHSVNAYWASAIKGVRSVLGLKPGIRMTYDTINRINNGDQESFFNAFKTWRINFYENSTNEKYKAAWIARTNKFVFVP